MHHVGFTILKYKHVAQPAHVPSSTETLNFFFCSGKHLFFIVRITQNTETHSVSKMQMAIF
jgi:hypothetical protein